MAVNLEALRALSQIRPTIEVEIPGTDGETARFRKIKVSEYRAIMAKSGGKDLNTVDFATDILAACWVDDDGANLFAGKDARSVLDGLAAEVLQPLLEKAIKFSGLDPEAPEGAEKN